MAKAKAKDTLLTKADTVRPYVERAMNDERLRAEVMRAFTTARDLYGDLIGDKDKPMVLASRVATDDDIRDKLREAIDDLRSASDRLQGKREAARGRAGTLLVAGIALGILFNPVTGAGDAAFHPRPDLVRGGRRHAARRGRTARASQPGLGRRDRRSEAGSRPSAVEMSVAPSRTTPGFRGADRPGTFGAHPVATGKAMLAMWRHEARYGDGVDGAVEAEEEHRDRMHLEVEVGRVASGSSRCRP